MICKCGHEEEMHRTTKGKYIRCLDNHGNCTCKKFQPNHSPSEDEFPKGIPGRPSSGGDSPLTNPEPDSVSRIDGGDLSSKIDIDRLGDEVIFVGHIKDFIQKLKEEFTNKWSLSLEIAIKKKIDKLAGASLTGLAKDDLI